MYLQSYNFIQLEHCLQYFILVETLSITLRTAVV